MIDQARAVLSEISTNPTGPAAGAQWKTIHGLLKKAPCDQMRLARCIAERDVDTMRSILDEVASAPPPAPRNAAPAPAGEAPAARSSMPPAVMVRAEKPTPQQLKTALAAFKKRLKLTKLDQESRLGHGPLSSGSKTTVIAILPPNLYPKIYWEELEKQGLIRNTGGGFYELVEKPKPVKEARIIDPNATPADPGPSATEPIE